MNNMEQPREPRLYKNDGMNILVNIEVEKIDEAIKKTKELITLLREANELTNSLSSKEEMTKSSPLHNWKC